MEQPARPIFSAREAKQQPPIATPTPVKEGTIRMTDNQ
jgi:hypothetical protein